MNLYGERRFNETEKEFWVRVDGGRHPESMSLADFKAACAYEYLAGGARREKLIKHGLGYISDRIKYYEKLTGCTA